MSPVLDAFETYLIVLNVVTFLLHAVDFWLCRLTGEERISHAFLGVLAVAGGPAGALLAFLLWDRRTVKANAWHHVVVASAFLVWCTVVAFVYVTPFDPQTFVTNLTSRHTALAAYLVCVNAITLVLFGIDKLRAVQDRWRIREAVLLGFSLAGGSVGGLLGMATFRHKIRSPQFRYGLLTMLAAQLVALAWLVNAGLV